MSIVVAATEENISRAAELLMAGELVCFPTETVYGIGADASNPEAVRRIFHAKGRPADHPLIIHLPAAELLNEWVEDVPDEARILAENFWPGPLTIVLKRGSAVPLEVTGGQETVAVRVPSHPVASKLLSRFGGALAAPSANRFGRISPTRAEHAAMELGAAVSMVLDGGPSEVGVESTIVDLSGKTPLLLRPGGVPRERLAVALGAPLQGAEAGSGPRAPGRLASHYAPDTPTRLLSRAQLDAVGPLSGGVSVLSRRAAPVGFPGVWLQLPDEPEGYARELYGSLRELDAMGREILVEAPPVGPEWEAVRDRLQRAVGSRVSDPDTPSFAAAASAESPLVAVVMGSSSDWETMRHADALLDEFGVTHSCRVVSAHRTPDLLARFAREAAGQGTEVIIAGAGGAAHLPGMIAAHTPLPVLGVPVKSRALNGLDSLLSIVQMPRGVAVGTLAVGEAGATNAALLACQILALSRPELAKRVLAYRVRQSEAASSSELPTPNFRPNS